MLIFIGNANGPQVAVKELGNLSGRLEVFAVLALLACIQQHAPQHGGMHPTPQRIIRIRTAIPIIPILVQAATLPGFRYIRYFYP